MRRPPSKEATGRPFWRDTDGFTTRDFKVVLTGLTWLASTAWMVWLLMAREAGDLHLRFYSNVSQVFMVLLGGMAVQQFGSMWGGGYGGGGYGGSYGDQYGQYGQQYPPQAGQGYPTEDKEGLS